ncbi:glycosyltransferase family 2 protein [Testudinibacter aquarius]|uniref:GalNAc5-diNAcBac-PP-undecaprenol beta-1,3-glucosyltransferase n=1 Tax=Testudinibacter aquarius TaxID=1524974 RepID=A0A4R3Y9T2_9PAST|nr:glycosyltransferase family 2 protein [Testudinibacter aquarius]TCV88660.1 GalNAc5-diNAcBac-PP-undecaprenol beta-1,3-glucosyltransferase [Testudinibacter aquarius]
MNKFTLSVVIPTYNRPDLVIRAVESVIAERDDTYNKVEIIVVDDNSSIESPDLSVYQDLIFYRMPVNGGPGPARMKGINLATCSWVLMLDDDDILMQGSVRYLANLLSKLEEDDYPVYQFSTKKVYQVEQIKNNFLLATFDDYMNKVIIDDLTAVFNRKKFLSTGLQYPDNRVGGEHLLWWKIAERYGVPSYAHQIVSVSDDAHVRLTHFSSQIKNAAHYQELAEMTLKDFGERLCSDYPSEYRRIQLAYITYSLLNKQSKKARHILKTARINKILKVILWIISWLPDYFIKKLFLFYRNYNG